VILWVQIHVYNHFQLTLELDTEPKDWIFRIWAVSYFVIPTSLVFASGESIWKRLDWTLGSLVMLAILIVPNLFLGLWLDSKLSID